MVALNFPVTRVAAKVFTPLIEVSSAGYYKLVGRQVIPVEGVLEWAKYFDYEDRHVGDDLVGEYRVSTVFLGLDHGFGNELLLFETMIFNDKLDEVYCERYTTYDQAEGGHIKAMERARGLAK